MDITEQAGNVKKGWNEFCSQIENELVIDNKIKELGIPLNDVRKIEALYSLIFDSHNDQDLYKSLLDSYETFQQDIKDGYY